ncbi:MAG: peptidylprolyl isomerase [Sphingomonas sp.]
MILSALIAATLLQAGSPAIPPGMARPIAAGILADAPAQAWRRVPAEDLLVMDLADGARIVIELAGDHAPVHVANIRALARAHWWDGTSVNRVQDNYVVQWGDATERKALPPGIVAQPPAEYERPATGLAFRPLGYRDSYAAETGHDAKGWPMAREGKAAWLTHCYGSVGVGRNLPPDTGTGAELYTVIGQSPRQLDRNITVVGRVLGGIDRLAARPRGTAELGFYARAEERVGIVRARLAADLPVAERPAYEVLRPGSPAFARWVEARANRRDPFFVTPAGAVDICNALAPVRAVAR